MSHLYAVVKFADNSFSEIPVKWLFDNDSSCWWPSKHKNPSGLMLKDIQPDVNTWEIHEVHVECYTSTLEAARKKAGDIDYSTAEELIENTGRGKRKKKTKIVTSSSEEESNVSEGTPPPKLRKKIFNETTNKETEVEAVLLLESSVVEDTNKEIDNPVDTYELPNDHVIDLLQEESGSTLTVKSSDESHLIMMEILKTVGAVKEYCKSMDSRLKSLESNKQKQDHLLNQCEAVESLFPLKTVEELDSFELLLKKDPNMVEKFRTYISTVGGRDAKDTLQRILKKIFTNELGTKCSWHGLRQNFKCSDLETTKIIKRLLLIQYTEFQEHGFEKVFSEWLRLSKLRLLREKK